eukprot:SAG31_NODE_2481_length_5630_cov_2.585005_3_plen_327_part_00
MSGWIAGLQPLQRRGHLRKRGRPTALSGGAWATYFFDVDDEYMCYYQTEASSAYIPNETIDLSHLQWVGSCTADLYGFEVAITGGKTFVLAADSLGNRDAWVFTLRINWLLRTGCETFWTAIARHVGPQLHSIPGDVTAPNLNTHERVQRFFNDDKSTFASAVSCNGASRSTTTSEQGMSPEFILRVRAQSTSDHHMCRFCCCMRQAHGETAIDDCHDTESGLGAPKNELVDKESSSITCASTETGQHAQVRIERVDQPQSCTSAPSTACSTANAEEVLCAPDIQSSSNSSQNRPPRKLPKLKIPHQATLPTLPELTRLPPGSGCI